MPGLIVGYVHPLVVHARFHNALSAMVDHDRANSGHIVGEVALLSGPRIAEARCQVVDAFIDHPMKPEWLLMLDSDMVFLPTLVDELMAVADPEAAPIVGGLCFAGVHGHKIFPTVYRAWNEDDGHLAVEPVDEYPRDSLVRVGATGAACILIHRSVFAVMKRPSPKAGERFDPAIHGWGTLPNGNENPYPWFAEGGTTSKGVPLGEDVGFCRRAMMLGIPIYVNTAIKLGHSKEWVIREDDFDAYVRERDRPGPLLDAALVVLRESGRFAPDELNQIADYLRPRRSILSDTDRPKPKPFLLPEPVA